MDLPGRSIVLDGGEIGALSIKNNCVVLGSSKGKLMQYPIVGSQVQPTDMGEVNLFDCNSAIIAISMDELNREGYVGTEAG